MTSWRVVCPGTKWWQVSKIHTKITLSTLQSTMISKVSSSLVECLEMVNKISFFSWGSINTIHIWREWTTLAFLPLRLIQFLKKSIRIHLLSYLESCMTEISDCIALNRDSLLEFINFKGDSFLVELEAL